jgi:hypothetical protein
MNKRHPKAAVQHSKINILLNLPNLNSLTNQNFIAGPNQAAEEASQLIPGTEFSIITAAPLIELGESTSNSQEIMPTIQATGQPWEATQQTFVPHGTTPAVAQQFTEGNNSSGIKLGELTSNSQEIMPTIQATGQPWEVTQQTSVPHGTTPAVAQQFTEGNNSSGIKLGELTSNSQEIMPNIQAKGQPWEVTQQTSVPHGTTPAVAQQFTVGTNSIEIKLGEFTSNSQETMPTQQASTHCVSVILTERPKAVGVPKTRKYSDTNTIHKATMEPGNAVKFPNRYPIMEPLAHNKLTSPSPLSLSLHRYLTLTFPDEAQPYNRHIITTYSNLLCSLHTPLLSSTSVISKAIITYSQIYPNYTDHSPHTPPSCSNYPYYPMLYPLIRSYQQLNPHITLLITYCIDHNPTAFPHSTIYGSTYHSQNYKQTQLNFKFNYFTDPKLYKSTRTCIQLNYPGKLSSPCFNPDQFLLWKINSSLSTQVERPKAGGVPKTSKSLSTLSPKHSPCAAPPSDSDRTRICVHCQAQTYQC